VTFVRTADMRYVGQGAEIEVTLPDGPVSGLSAEALLAEFEDGYKQLFSRAVPDAPVEAVTWRLAAFGPPPAVDFTAALARRSGALDGGGTSGDARTGTRRAYFPHWGEYRDVPVYNRYALGPGSGGDGPAIIEERESTAIVPPDAAWHVNDVGVLTIELGAAEGGTTA
jgi:N-methylhydantoinase A